MQVLKNSKIWKSFFRIAHCTLTLHKFGTSAFHADPKQAQLLIKATDISICSRNNASKRNVDRDVLSWHLIDDLAFICRAISWQRKFDGQTNAAIRSAEFFYTVSVETKEWFNFEMLKTTKFYKWYKFNVFDWKLLIDCAEIWSFGW